MKGTGNKRNAPLKMILPQWKGTNAKGRETRELILRSALSVLVDEGFRSMSMRRVAAKSGIEFGNLTYHYPSREDLVTELLESVFRAYTAAGTDIKQHQHLPPQERLVEMCRYASEEARVKQTSHLMPELWTLSNHDAFVAKMIDAAYESGVAPLREIIAEMRPDLTADACTALSMFVAAALDSFVIYAGHRKTYEPWAPAFMRIAAKSYVELLKNITSEEIGTLPALRRPPAKRAAKASRRR